MAKIKVSQLIDLAIGTPEPGYVNFYALHCFLGCVAEKLDMTEEIVDYSKYELMMYNKNCKPENSGYMNPARKLGGSNKVKKSSEGEEESVSIPNNAALIESVVSDLILEQIPSEQTIPTAETSNVNVQRPAAESLSSSKEILSLKQMHYENLDPQFPTPQSLTKDSARSIEILPSSELSIDELNSRISEMEMTMQKITIPESHSTDISKIEDHLELAVEQLLRLTYLTLQKNSDSNQFQQLYTMAQLLRETQKVDPNRNELTTITSPNWSSLKRQFDKGISKENLMDVQCSVSKIVNTVSPNQYELESHLCYSPEKIIDQLMELKGEFCLLTNKVNELSAFLLQQESQRTLALISEMQEEMRDLKLTILKLKEQEDRIGVNITRNVQDIEKTKKSIELITAEKVNKDELEVMLAGKVDYNQLQRKISLDQMQEMQCHIEQKFGEVLRKINDNDKKFALTVDHLQDTLGFTAIDGVLTSLKEQIETKIQKLQILLQNYIESTDDECAAAGARTKVLHNLACISCDNNCVMRSREKVKVAKLSNAHASNILSPLITYELGSIRKSGIMGYHRKDEFPHAPSAWMSRQSVGLNMKICTARHAGGSHTTSTAKERVEKVLLNKK